jgi:adenosylmethionine-8-amino-7-oxononanoate aminotransferase
MAHPHIWYPFTQAKNALEPIKVKSAQGLWLGLEDGRQIMDCISSWWVTLHGHGHPQIAEAIYHQALSLDQVVFASCTHEPAEQLAEQLVATLANSLNRVFFSDNGSTAVEIGLKIAYQYWANRQESRTHFLAFEGAYHGDTFGAMAVGARSLFTEVFEDLLFEVEFIPFAATHLREMAGDRRTLETREAQILEQLTHRLQTQGDRYAGFIVEPLVQGAGGMRMCRPEFLQRLVQICQRYGILVIFDEVMTGFGRTGDWFACHKTQVQPDIICLAKGITGGFLPLAVTLCTETLYQGFCSSDPTHTLYHGHSYAANPLGCAAALASLQLLRDQAYRFQDLEAQHLSQVQALIDHPRLQNIRVMGTIAAFDVVVSQPGYLNQIGLQLRQKFLDRGFLIRPLGNVLYLIPPYCIEPEELVQIYQAIPKVLSEIQT